MTRTLIVLLWLTASAAQAAAADSLYQRKETWAESLLATRRNVAAATGDEDLHVVWEDLAKRFWNEWPETDWLMQDGPHRVPGSDEVDAYRELGWYFDPSRDASAEQQLICRVLDECESSAESSAALRQVPEAQPTGTAAQAAELRGRLARLASANATPDEPEWLNVYLQACQLRRSQRLRTLQAECPQFVFTKHYTLGGSHYAYTEGQSDAQAERHFVPGSALCLASWDGQRVVVDSLIEDPRGVIRDPDVSFDGRRVLFAWKKSDREDDYHLYELDLKTRSVRQLTHGLGVADYEGVYLPDGEILFNSTRCVQIVDCWWTEVSNLYRCDADGGSLRRLAYDQVHDNYPTVTDDSRILYTRWEYNDRGQIYPQPLLQMNPDGTNQREFYGVNSWFPTTILHARGVPGTQKAVAIATGHHSRQTGKLILIDPARGRQEAAGIQLIAPQRETPAVKIDAFGQDGELFQYPYPLSETEYLVTYHPIGWSWREGGMGPRFGIYWMASDGRREQLVADGSLPCSQSIPVRPRSVRRVRPDTVDYSQSTGTCYVQDVYASPCLQGVPRGAVKKIRVVSILYRSSGIGSNGNGGPGGGALVSTPVAIGNGAWDPKVILGDATVQDDGSAFFRVPARQPIYFQLLDDKNRMVQTMRSWSTLQPGENVSCVGCHEHKNSSPVAAGPLTAALSQPAEQLSPFYGSARGFSFAREIQPILDRHCVRCHDGQPHNEPPDLTAGAVADGRAKRLWSRSYLELTHARPDNADDGSGWRGNPDHPLLNWTSAQSAPPLQPAYSVGAARSGLIRLLEEGHEDVVLSPEDLDKLSAWIDLGVPFCADYFEANDWTDAERQMYEHFEAKRQRLAVE